MQPDHPIFANPREIPTDCVCRWENVDQPGGLMRLAETGRRCPLHTEPDPTGSEDVFLRKSACRCVTVPTGKGWDRRLVEIVPGCVYHASVVLGARDVAPWAMNGKG